jgi:hypothetical protein
MNKKLLSEFIKQEYEILLFEQRVSDVSKYYTGQKIWYNHLEPLSSSRNRLYKWDEIFRKVGINPSRIFAIGDEGINGNRSMVWFKCDKKHIDPIQFAKKLSDTNDQFYSSGQWRIVENNDSFFVLEYDVDM